MQEVLQRRWDTWRWAQWPGIGSWQWPFENNHQSWSFYNYMGSCLRTQRQPFYSCSAFEQLKQPNKWVPRELTENQNNHHFEVSSSLTLSNNNKKFIDWFVTCNKKWIKQLAMTSSLVGPGKSSKILPKPNLHQTKRS